jgi:hypothetical protein
MDADGFWSSGWLQAAIVAVAVLAAVVAAMTWPL